MSVKRPSNIPKALLFTALLLIGVVITWLDFRTGPSPVLTLLTLGYVVAASIGARTAMKRPVEPVVAEQPRSRTADVIKSAVFMLFGLLWGAVGVKVLPDTWTSVVIVLVPFGVLAMTSAYFFARSLWIPLR